MDTRYLAIPEDGGEEILKRHLLIIALTAVVTITMCSRCSPLYPFNISPDANCFFTVGRSMLHGKVPYRDLVEQKGPLLYMLYALAALASETTFLGVYVLEILACAAFLFYAYKVMRLYCGAANIWLIPPLAAAVYSARGFSYGGSTAEELCLPFFAFAVYAGLRSLRRRQALSCLECLAVGAMSACVLWVKFSLLGFYVGWICVPAFLLIKNGKVKELLRTLLLIAVGVLAVSVPILAYFAVNQSLSDLWAVYFHDNLFLYTRLSKSSLIVSALSNLTEGAKNVLYNNAIPAAMAGIGGLALLEKREKADFWFFAASLSGTFLLVYIGGRRYAYYSLIFSAFAPVGMAALELARNCCKRYLCARPARIAFKYCGALICALSAAFAFAMSDNTYFMRYSKSDLPQYKFAEIISKVEGATLLNYGFLDAGFYTAAGIIPNCRYFCRLNIPLKEMMDTQKEFVEGGKVDFVVTANSELKSSLYKCVASADLSGRKYRLYQLSGIKE